MGLVLLARARRARRVPVALAVIGALLLSACLTEEEKQASGMLTATRAQHKLQALQPHDQLQAKAHAWAEQMARSGAVSHSTLTDGVTAPWRALGETVSSAGSLEDAFEAQMRSQSHRRVITDGRFTHVGVGVARGSDGSIYLALVFMQL